MHLKRILLLVMILCMNINLCYAREIVEKIEFSSYSENEIPSDWVIKASEGNVSVKEKSISGKKAKTLLLSDANSSGENGVAAMKTFDGISGKIGFEIKFLIENELGGFEVIAGGQDGAAVSFASGSDGAAIASNGSGNIRFSDVIKLKNWNTLRFVTDTKTGRYDIRLNGNMLSGLAMCGNYSKPVNYITLKTTYKKPSVYIEYIQLEKGADIDAGIQDIEAPRVKAPVPHAIKDEINVMVNGEYHYFDYKPVMINNRVLLPLRRVFEMFGIEVEWTEETKTVICKKDSVKIEVVIDSNKAFVNGEEKILDVPATIIEKSTYIPIRFVAESIGAEVLWEDSTRTVIINKGV